jgi:hypothetical protein
LRGALRVGRCRKSKSGEECKCGNALHGTSASGGRQPLPYAPQVQTAFNSQ